MRRPSWEGVPGSAVQTTSCWSGSVAQVRASQSRVSSCGDGVVQNLAAPAPGGDVVVAPPAPEVVVPHGEFTDEGRHALVLRITARFHAEHGDAGVRGVLPVRVKCFHRRFGENQPRVVAILLGNAREIGEQCRGHRIPGENVHAAAHDESRRGGELVEEPPQLRLDLLRGLTARAGGVLAA